jgi:serine/threonine-protein phosphatase 4 regulatory subunit 1
MSQEIDQEETFKLREINEEDPNAVYVEFNPEIALEKLINLEKLKFNEKQSYTRHLAELIGIIGDKGLRALPGIFQNYIKESQQIKR